jgi:hypothetical protein
MMRINKSGREIMFTVRRLPVVIAVLFGLLLGACGGGGGGSSGGGGGGTDPKVASVEIQQTGLMLTEMGASRQLTAKAYDAQRNVLDVPITWSSTTASEIAIDGTGKVTARVQNGSSQIVAQAGGVKSAPLLVAVTVLPAGAITLTDAQIVGDPVETDPNALPSFNNTYQVVLTGISPPAIGVLLINTESKPVAGRVVAVDSSSGQTTVTLALVSLREMFPNLTINQVIDLSQAPVSIAPEIAAAYNVQRTGNTHTFTPKTSGSMPIAAAALRGWGPFAKCEGSISGESLPFQLAVPPVFSISDNLGLDLVYNANTGLERFVVKGERLFKAEASAAVTAAFEGKYSCEAELFTIKIPIGGPLSLLVGGLVPVKAGFEIGGKVAVTSVSLGFKGEGKVTAEIGVACTNGASCAFVRNVTGTGTGEPVWTPPSLAGNRYEPSFGTFVKLEVAIGNPFLKALRFEAFRAQAGPKFEGSFAAMSTQIADTTYKSTYKGVFEAKAGAGTTLGDALKLFGLDFIALAEFASSIEIAMSPIASVTADRTSFAAGDVVNFTVKFDPATIKLFPLIGPYNVEKVFLVRQVPGALSPETVAAVGASPGQIDLVIPFSAPNAGSVAEFTAFVVTAALPYEPFALELATATGHGSPRLSASYSIQDIASIHRDGYSRDSKIENAVDINYPLRRVSDTEFEVVGGVTSYRHTIDDVEVRDTVSINCSYTETNVTQGSGSSASEVSGLRIPFVINSDGSYSLHFGAPEIEVLTTTVHSVRFTNLSSSDCNVADWTYEPYTGGSWVGFSFSGGGVVDPTNPTVITGSDTKAVSNGDATETTTVIWSLTLQ